MDEQELHSRLIEWANWALRKTDHGLGFPRQTREYRLQRDGVLIRVAGNFIEPVNEAAEEVERWMVELNFYNPQLFKTIKEKYQSRHQTPNVEIARKMGISLRAFENKLYLAKAWLMGFLTNLQKRYKTY